MKKVDTLKQLEKELKKVNSIVAEDTGFIAKGIMYIANKLTDEKRDKFHWLIGFLRLNKLVIGSKEGEGFKELTFEELHDIYED